MEIIVSIMAMGIKFYSISMALIVNTSFYIYNYLLFHSLNYSVNIDIYCATLSGNGILNKTQYGSYGSQI